MLEESNVRLARAFNILERRGIKRFSFLCKKDDVDVYFERFTIML